MSTKLTYNEIYKSRWLKSEDIQDEDLVVTIKDVNDEAVGQEREMKLILSFVELDKELVLNKTNAKMLADKFGKDPNAWIGKRIALFTTEVDFAGKTTLAIRIRLKSPTQTIQPTSGQEETIPY